MNKFSFVSCSRRSLLTSDLGINNLQSTSSKIMIKKLIYVFTHDVNISVACYHSSFAWNLLLHVYLWNHWPMCSEAKANSESVRVMSAFMLDFLKSVQTNVSLQGHTVVGSLSLSLYLCVCLFPSNNKRDRQTDREIKLRLMLSLLLDISISKTTYCCVRFIQVKRIQKLTFLFLSWNQ